MKLSFAQEERTINSRCLAKLRWAAAPLWHNAIGENLVRVKRQGVARPRGGLRAAGCRCATGPP